MASVVSSYMKSLGVGLFTTRTVGELLWGYEDSLLKFAKKFKPELDDVFGLFYKVSLARAHVLLLLAPDVCREFWINLPSPSGFSHRATLPTTASTSSSPVKTTTETFPEWTRGRVKGNLTPPPSLFFCSPDRVRLI